MEEEPQSFDGVEDRYALEGEFPGEEGVERDETRVEEDEDGGGVEDDGEGGVDDGKGYDGVQEPEDEADGEAEE
jgi:hypothetical protein